MAAVVAMGISCGKETETATPDSNNGIHTSDYRDAFVGTYASNAYCYSWSAGTASNVSSESGLIEVAKDAASSNKLVLSGLVNAVVAIDREGKVIDENPSPDYAIASFSSDSLIVRVRDNTSAGGRGYNHCDYLGSK
ncbi:MAG TPA: hypothetical protein VEY71_06865 [Chitinophagales bacterium]|nr:hypothetical protein [Chitinophagales bacterium]